MMEGSMLDIGLCLWNALLTPIKSSESKVCRGKIVIGVSSARKNNSEGRNVCDIFAGNAIMKM